MQNVVMRTRQEAVEAACAPFELSVCTGCGLAFNSRFAPELLHYDSRYDNDVPSSVFAQYYTHIAGLLRDQLALNEGTVYDVGCGKGAFLDELCRLCPAVQGVGIDPSCVPRERGRVSLIRGLFSPEQLTQDPSLVLCRHVLEHIEDPVAFVRMLSASLRRYPGCPLYLEVPELDWIFRNGAFWDFCYEHCNYFTRSSLERTARMGGFDKLHAATSFEGQYQWLLCRGAAETVSDHDTASMILERAQRYAEWEQDRIRVVRDRVEVASKQGSCILWGMATKGVVFANMIDPTGELIDGGVDMNTKKHRRFVPGAGHEIHEPAWIKQLAGPLTIVVMNPNYASEIGEQVRQLNVTAELITF